MKKICAFLDGALFPVLFGALVFLFYAFHLPIVGLATCFLVASFIFLFSEDTRPAIPVAFLVIMTSCYKYDLAPYLTRSAIVSYVVLGIVFFFSLFYRLCMRRVEWRNRTGLLSMSLFCAAILIGGAFSKYYSLLNAGFALGYAAVGFVFYAFFAFTMKKREDNLLYLARVCAVTAVVISLQVFELYLRIYDGHSLSNDSWKGQIILGWSISNMAAEMIVFFFPAVLYLIYTERLGYLYWLVLALCTFAVLLTLCRNALLWGGVAILVGLVVNCIGGRNKIINRFIAGVIGVLAAVFLVLSYGQGEFDKLFGFFKDGQLMDHGRFEIWQRHIYLFLEAPINGVGFQTYRTLLYTRVTYAHNTLIQLLASTGLIGTVLYLVHRVQTVCMALKKPTAGKLFAFGCIFIMLAMSMLSLTLFLPYFMIYYAVILLFIEKE